AADYNPSVLSVAEERFKIYDNAKLRKLSDDILMGVPGEASATKEGLLRSIKAYKEIGRDGLRENLAFFLNEIMDTCEENGINMTIHPDDPPIEILGLPRIVSSLKDIQWLLQEVNRKPNGLCYCTGSLGAGKHNDLVEILNKVGERVYFVHLRNVIK